MMGFSFFIGSAPPVHSIFSSMYYRQVLYFFLLYHRKLWGRVFKGKDKGEVSKNSVNVITKLVEKSALLTLK